MIIAAGAVTRAPRWQAAMRPRGIDDLELGADRPVAARHLRSSRTRRAGGSPRCISYLRHDPDDNGYARPDRGRRSSTSTCGTGEVLHVEDTASCRCRPRRAATTTPSTTAPLRDDLQPLEITQPEGPSFTVDGNLVRWQRWQLRVSMHPIEGLVLHQVAYDDGDRSAAPDRCTVPRLSEMVVPYGATDPAQSWKNAFDAGEWGIGRFVNSLELGCDCLGEIHYLDVGRSTSTATPTSARNAICMHEEDYGILWKHQDLHSFRTEVRRQRRLVVSSIYTVGNYEYGFYWYFYLDGSIAARGEAHRHRAAAGGGAGRRPEQRQPDRAGPRGTPPPAPVLRPPRHGGRRSRQLAWSRSTSSRRPPGPDNPLHNGFRRRGDAARRSEQAAQRDVDPARSRTWRIVNPASHQPAGPAGRATSSCPAAPTDCWPPRVAWVRERAGFATHNLWVTPYDPTSGAPPATTPTSRPAATACRPGRAADRPIDDTEIVVWHTFGVTHLVRPEDWPVMPVEYDRLLLIPVGFFDRTPRSTCHRRRHIAADSSRVTGTPHPVEPATGHMGVSSPPARLAHHH